MRTAMTIDVGKPLQIGDRVRICGFRVNGAAYVVEETDLWCCGQRIVRVRTDFGETGHFCQSRLVLLTHALAGFSDDDVTATS
jgi:hypothetical protein